jgi:hypothetical protein
MIEVHREFPSGKNLQVTVWDTPALPDGIDSGICREVRHPAILNLVRALLSMPQRNEEEKSQLQEKGVGNAHPRSGRWCTLKILMDKKCVDGGKRFVEPVKMDDGVARYRFGMAEIPGAEINHR